MPLSTSEDTRLLGKPKVKHEPKVVAKTYKQALLNPKDEVNTQTICSYPMQISPLLVV